MKQSQIKQAVLIILVTSFTAARLQSQEKNGDLTAYQALAKILE